MNERKKEAKLEQIAIGLCLSTLAAIFSVFFQFIQMRNKFWKGKEGAKGSTKAASQPPRPVVVNLSIAVDLLTVLKELFATAKKTSLRPKKLK